MSAAPMSGLKRLGIIAIACLMAAGLLFILGKRGPSSLPDFDSVEFVPFDSKLPATLQWNGAEAPAIGALFDGVERDLRPMKWQVLGQLTLFQSGKSVGKIEVFSNSQGVGPFKIGDDYYLGYDQAAFQKALGR